MSRTDRARDPVPETQSGHSGPVLPTLARVVTGLSFGLVAAAPAFAHSLDELEGDLLEREAYLEVVHRPAPDFALHDATGAEVRLSDYRGKVVVLWFIYTNCPDICPLHSAKIAAIQEMANATPMREAVHFIAITTDPERDTPVVLDAYLDSHGLDTANTVLLTSGPDEPAATRQIARRYGLKFTLRANDYQLHAAVTHLIDKSGSLRARYHGLKFDPTTFVVHLNALTNDYH